MSHQELPLPLDVCLRLKIALLERDLAQVQARLLTTSAEQQYLVALTTLLQLARITPPVPLTQCMLDLEHGVLRWEGPPCAESAALN